MLTKRGVHSVRSLYAMVFSISAVLMLFICGVLFIDDPYNKEGPFYFFSAMLFIFGAYSCFHKQPRHKRESRVYHAFIGLGIILAFVGLPLGNTGYWAVGFIMVAIGVFGGLRK
jgi:hypothetical protein